MSTVISDAGFQFANGDTQAYPVVPVRQTVLFGTVDSSGFSSFGGSTGSTTVTTSTTLITTSSNGTSNRTGSITNPSWTGLSTNGMMYLYLDIAADGTCTTGSATLAPTYQWGGTYSTTNNQFTFNIQEMTGKVGNGATAAQTYRVFVGQVTVAGGVVTAIVWYQLMGRYDSGYTATLPAASTQTSKNHNIGVVPEGRRLILKCTTTDGGYVVGDTLENFLTLDTGNYTPISLVATDLTVGFSNLPSIPWRAPNKAGTSYINSLTAASWSYKVTAVRGW